jgi:hypothetical protein
MKLLIQLLILSRVFTNDGLFTEQRKFPVRKESPEIRRVTRKRGKQSKRTI